MRDGEWVVEYRGGASGQWYERGRHPDRGGADRQADEERARRGPDVEVRSRAVTAEKQRKAAAVAA